MPVRFLCPACHQLLGIASRKIGAQVNCPKCQAAIIVPDPKESAGADDAQFEPTVFEDALSEIVETELADPPITADGTSQRVAIKPAPARKTPPPMTEPSANPTRQGTSTGARTDAADLGVTNPAMVMIPRRMLYIQAALIAGVALVFFLAGLWIGHMSR